MVSKYIFFDNYKKLSFSIRLVGETQLMHSKSVVSLINVKIKLKEEQSMKAFI